MIRLLTIDDYEAMLDLWRSCSGMGLNDADDSREGIARYLARNPHTCFGAEDEHGLIGVILAGHDGRRGYIYHTAVHPSHRGQGIGSALAETALAALREENISKVALVVFAHHEGGNAFWEKQGFTGREDLVYRNRALRELVRKDT